MNNLQHSIQYLKECKNKIIFEGETYISTRGFEPLKAAIEAMKEKAKRDECIQKMTELRGLGITIENFNFQENMTSLKIENEWLKAKIKEYENN